MQSTHNHINVRYIINNAEPEVRYKLRSHLACRCCSNHQKLKLNTTHDNLLQDLTLLECNCQCADEILRFVRNKVWGDQALASPVVVVSIPEINIGLNGITGRHDGVMSCEDIPTIEDISLKEHVPDKRSPRMAANGTAPQVSPRIPSSPSRRNLFWSNANRSFRKSTWHHLSFRSLLKSKEV